MKVFTKADVYALLESLDVSHDSTILLQVAPQFSLCISGGNQAIVDACLDYIEDKGVCIVPTFTFNTLDPSCMDAIAYEEWKKYRKEVHGFRKELSETDAFGNQFLRNKKVGRTNHPVYSFGYYGDAGSSVIKPNLQFPLSMNNGLQFMQNEGSVNVLLGVDKTDALFFQGVASQKELGQVYVSKARMYRKNGSTSRVFLNRKYSASDLNSVMHFCTCKSVECIGMTNYSIFLNKGFTFNSK